MFVDITNAERVYTLTFVHFDGLNGPEKVALRLNVLHKHLYIGKTKGEDTVLFSTDSLLIESLYSLCWLAHYDAHKFISPRGGMSVLHPIGSDGSGNCFEPDKSLFMRVNNKRPDKYFEEV